MPPYHRYGYRVGQWFYAMNVLAELDRPGEWYLDREAGILYFWPPAPIDRGHPTVSVSDTLVSLSNLSNLIHHAPHMAIGFSGNDHVIEFNEIHNVCLESNDAGAIYAGRDWTMRGTVIRHNYLHEITGFEGRGCVGVYLDDMFCGTKIWGNVFCRVTRAAFIGGGRDCLIENNIFVDCRPALHIDARATGWAGYHVETTMTQRLNAMPYKSNPWRTRYPALVNILQDEPAVPKGNVVARNICSGGRWDEVYDNARSHITFSDNWVTDRAISAGTSPQTSELSDSPAAHKIGFDPIPFERIGLFADEHRAQIAPK